MLEILDADDSEFGSEDESDSETDSDEGSAYGKPDPASDTSTSSECDSDDKPLAQHVPKPATSRKKKLYHGRDNKSLLQRVER